MMITALLLISFLATLSAFKLSQLPKFTLPKQAVIIAPTLLTPALAFADDGGGQSAFLVPLAISVLTMGPFLYYQQ